MKATIHVTRKRLFKASQYQCCESICNVNLSDVDQVLTISESVKNLRKVLASMGYDEIKVFVRQETEFMDNFTHAAKLKEMEARKDYIKQHPDQSNEQLAKKWKVSVSTIEKDKKKIANRKEFEV